MSLTLATSVGPNSTRGTRRLSARSLGLALLALAMTAIAAPGDVAFAPPVSSAVGVNPRAIAAGDYNEDGKLDAVIANFNSNTISTLLGNGNGTFGAATNLSVGANPAAVLLVKLNNDSHLDIAVANFSSNTVSIRLGSGTAVFGPVVNYAAGSLPTAMTSGDFDGDNDEDLAVANFGTNAVSLLRNNGDGSFAAPVAFAVGTNPRALVAGDFNGDSRLDLATANDLSNNVSVLLGNGDGTFAAAANFAVGTRPFSLAAGDFNGDSKLDLAAGNQNTSSISMLMGNGNGTFAGAVTIPAGMPVLSLVAADFNNDSKLDLAFGSTVSNMLMVLTGNGNGTFQAVMSFAAGNTININALAVGDWTGDGLPDVAAAHPTTATFDVLVNTSTPAVTNQPPSVDAGMDQTVACAGTNGTLVQLSGTASDPDGDALSYSWADENGNVVGLTAGVQVQVAAGMHTFTLTVDDGHGNTASDTVMVTVGDSMAPSLNLFLMPTKLWPANHNMMEVTAALGASDSCGAVSVTLDSITSNEADSGLGDGDLPNDIQGAAYGADDRSFRLRAERFGKGGRVYTVRYIATDAAGNTTSVDGQVTVPHDNGVRGKPSTPPGLINYPRR